MKKLLLILGLTIITAMPAAAQDVPATTVTEINYTQLDGDLNKINQTLSSGKVSSKETGTYLQQINQIQADVSQARSGYSANLDTAQKKLDALGEAPEKSSSEAPEIAKQRKEITATVNKYKSLIAQADLVKTRIDEINNLILKIRNQELLDTILAKQTSILHPHEFWTSLVSFSSFLYQIVVSPVSWYQNLTVTERGLVNSNVIYVALAMIAALIGAAYLKREIRKYFGYRSSIERPDYSQKLRAGLWMLAARGLIPAAIIGAFLIWQKNIPVIKGGAFGFLLKDAALYLLYYYLIKAVIKVIFTPYNGKWRLIEVCDDKAQSISSALIFSTAAICLVSFFQAMTDEMEYNPSIIYSLKIFANAVKAFCIVLVSRRWLYDNKDLSDDELNDDENVSDLSTSSKVSLAITFVMAAAFGLSLLGYIRLSEFIVNRFIISALVVGVVYMLDKLLRVLFHRVLLFRFWIRTFRISRRKLVKTEFWFGLLLTPVLGVVTIFMLLGIWGMSVDIMLNQIKDFLTGFNVGGIRISITSILLGIICFFLSMFVFKLLKDSLNHGNLSKIEMDDGVRSSLTSAIGFIGMIFSVILAIAVMGGSFKSIAIIAGALSFGAGLGLQNIVSNLVAGMTILFERPIKIGDWVIIDGKEGIVTQISMRSTTLETWSKSNIIIPNSDILSKSVTNMTYANRMGRVEIKVGVDYSSDIALVRKTLLEIADSNADVLRTPAPSVAFTDLADSSLNFQLNCYTANVYNKSGIANDIREKIINRFRELKINIPFPQQVVYYQPENAPLEQS